MPSNRQRVVRRMTGTSKSGHVVAANSWGGGHSLAIEVRATVVPDSSAMSVSRPAERPGNYDLLGLAADLKRYRGRTGLLKGVGDAPWHRPAPRRSGGARRRDVAPRAIGRRSGRGTKSAVHAPGNDRRADDYRTARAGPAPQHY